MATRTRRAVRRGARGPGVPRDVRPAPPAADAASIPRWHAIVECVSAAYDHHERRLVDVRHETVDRLRALLEQRGLVPHRPAAAGPQAALRDSRRLGARCRRSRRRPEERSHPIEASRREESPDGARVARVVRSVLGPPCPPLRPTDVEHLISRLTAVVDTARAEERKRWRTVQQVVDQQAEDEVLGFTARTAPEAYLQQELRKLHAAVKRR